MKLTYTFKPGHAEGSASMKEVLGGKGANLAEMANLGLPVPPGVTIPTNRCTAYMEGSEKDRAMILGECVNATTVELDKLAEEYGDFLVSVRSGARVSMPGMMDTILNVGITADTLPKWSSILGERTALDCFRRLIQMYGEVVMHIPAEVFADTLNTVKGSKADTDMSVANLKEVVERFLEIYETFTGEAFPNTREAQLNGAIEAVFNSWNSERAIAYRNANNIPASWGTAVNVQKMVFGNLNDDSATGVLFTRNPSTGEAGIYGEYLVNAQGEDVVAGIRTPNPITEMGVWNASLYTELSEVAMNMETHYRDMQDMEFTVEGGKLWILQTRNGKRSAQAAFKIAFDLVAEGLIEKATAVGRVSAKQYSVLRRPQIDPAFKAAPTVKGIPASNGIVSGVAVFSKEAAAKCKEACILVRHETSPDDYPGMLKSVGILTTTGGSTSHAAVVARGMDKACVVGATDLIIGTMVKEGDKVTIDGSTGRVWVGVEVPVTTFKMEGHVSEIIDWAIGDADVTLNVEPRFDEKARLIDVDSEFPESGEVVVNVSNTASNGSPKADYTKRAMEKVLHTLRSRKNLRGMIDLNVNATSADDSEFLYFLGMDSAPATFEEDLNQRVRVLRQSQWPVSLKKRWTLNLPEGISEIQKAAIRKAGWKFVSKVNTLAEYMSAEGMVTFTEAFIAKMDAEGVSVEQLIALKKNAGMVMGSVPKSVKRTQLVFAVLGKAK